MNKSISWFLMVLVVFGSFAPFATARFAGTTSAGFYSGGYGSTVSTTRPTRAYFCFLSPVQPNFFSILRPILCLMHMYLLVIQTNVKSS